MVFRTIVKVTRTMASFRSERMLTPQQLLLTTDKLTPTTTTKDKSIIIAIISFITTPTWDSIITTNGNCKRITISNLVKTSISRLTTIPIEAYTTILNVIIANMVFVTLVNDLKMIYLVIIGWNHVSKVHGLCQMGTLTINGID